MVDNYVVHYGIKGQKWGVRRDRKKAARLQKKAESAKAGSKMLTEVGKQFGEDAAKKKTQASKQSTSIVGKLKKKRLESLSKESGEIKELMDRWSKEDKVRAKSLSAKSKELTKRANSKEKAIESKKKAEAVLKDPTTKMSDQKLKAEVKRLQMEENYHRLTNNKNAKNATTMQRGQAMAMEILANSARTNLQSIANKAMGDIINLGVDLAKNK